MFQQHWNRAGLQRLIDRSHVAGKILIAAATLGLSIAWLVLDDWDLPRAVVGRIIIQFGLLLAAGLAVAAIAERNQPYGMSGPGLFWLVLLGLGAAEALSNPSLTAAVEPSEALVIALAVAMSLGGHRWRALHAAAIAAAAVMLLLFGTIHLLHAASVADLMPSWMPQRHLTPFFTGSLLIAAGLAFASGRTRPIASRLVALMFVSWLPLVHLQRLVGDAESLFEWRFALTALALAGALLVIGDGRSRPELN